MRGWVKKKKSRRGKRVTSGEQEVRGQTGNSLFLEKKRASKVRGSDVLLQLL